MRWTVWPLRDRRRWRLALPAVVLMLSVVAGTQTGSVLCGAAAAVLLLISAAHVLTPVTYVIRSPGLEIHTLGRRHFIPWRRVKAYQPAADGATLYLSDRRRGDSTFSVHYSGGEPLAPQELQRHLSAARKMPAA